jgi:magnesium transporter
MTAPPPPTPPNGEPTASTAEDPTVAEELRQALIDAYLDDPSGDVSTLIGAVAELHPAELAALLTRLSDEDRAAILGVIDHRAIASAMDFVEPHFRGEVLQDAPTSAVTDTLLTVADDVATDIVQELEDEAATAALDALPEERREAIEALLEHAEETAGGRMTGQLITVLPSLTVADTLDALRQASPDQERPFYLYVTDEHRHLEGVLNLRSLITAAPERPVGELMDTELVTVRADVDQEEAARLLKQYKLLAVPVVDEHGHVIGTITADDLLNVLEDEATEDMFRMVGVSEEEDLRGVWRSVRYRLPWLLVNVAALLGAAWVVSRFEDTLSRVAIIAAFLPVVGGIGGNAGMQTLTVVVRSLALGRLEARSVARVAGREVASGLLLGVIMGLTVGASTLLWGEPWLGVIVALALVANVVIGVLAGVLIPMTLARLQQDPALSGSIWLTAITDLAGFAGFLTLATVLIERLEG